MAEIQQLEVLKPWDILDLSTPELRQQCLEVLLCKQVLKGEDTSQCFKALEYLKTSATDQKLQDIFLQKLQQQLRFPHWQKIAIASFTILGTLTFCTTAFYCFNFFQTEQYQSNSSIDKQIKELKLKEALNDLPN